MSKDRFGRRTFMKTTSALGLAATVGLPAATGPGLAAETTEPAQWTEEDVNQIELTDENTTPVIDHEPDQISDDRWVWDTWPLRNRDGSIATINGWQIIFSLTASNDLVPGDRHNHARISYFYSRNGKDWQEGGILFDEDKFYGNQQWAGSAMYDQEEEQIYHFYTAADALPDARQRLALAKGATIETGPHGVDITGPRNHHIIGEADGEMYETLDQSDGIITAFRDPWFFEHPKTGEPYLLFEGNTPTSADGPNNPRNFNGNVGVMKAANDELTEWELLPPNLEAVGVNQQLERPHYIFQDGKWYLFAITHKFTYAPGLEGPEGLHGWVADSLYGEYEPLNGSSLVIANPEEAPGQAYSWLAMPDGNDILAESFVNWTDVSSMEEIDDLSPEEQEEAFGGTLAPSVKIELNGNQTQFVTEHHDGHFPPAVGRNSR